MGSSPMNARFTFAAGVVSGASGLAAALAAGEGLVARA